ncbi:DUF4397 domain-containing protein [Flavobacterium granuli]|uniref:DUF4397 domain-containing protein n=1 Tax=Flavobacterium granuli TaxID=280093 RepID=A0A1M5TVH9_9FLAO|nr:DUF4397 domain-containing protein [Flavobacterium granuli]PRZ22873.1 hypothetical protein BC624_106122 [Flavobacterium granuli]SHH54787.1 hypothetical protein SAMN05443373_1163 [Flavobacterium granuli]
MKNIFNTIKKVTLPLLVLAMLASCGDEHDFTPYATSAPKNTANVKFIHSAVGSNGTNFQVNYFMGADKISSVGVTVGLPIGTTFGSVYPVTLYGLVQSGDQPFSVVTPKIAATSTAPEIPAVERVAGKLVTEKGKYYSNFLIGSPPNIAPVTYSTYQINDDFSVALDKTKAYIRFINVISNTPFTGFDLGIIKTTSISGAATTVTKEIQTYKNVTFKGGDEKFIAIEAQDPSDARGYQIQLRVPGSVTNNPTLASPSLIANQANSGTGIFVPRAGRIYTIFCRGFLGGLSAGAPSATVNIPTIGWYTNN